MSIKEIITVPDEILKKVSQPIEKIGVNEKKLIDELNNILVWVDELQKVNTQEVEPMLSVFNESMNMRKDNPESNFKSDQILENAPEKNAGFFVVPKVVE